MTAAPFFIETDSVFVPYLFVAGAVFFVLMGLQMLARPAWRRRPLLEMWERYGGADAQVVPEEDSHDQANGLTTSTEP